jgi:hypothetical protein
MKFLLHRCLLKLFEKCYGPSIYIKLASSLYALPEKVEHQGDFVTNPREVLQGVLNSSVIPFHLYRIWPFWVYKQLNPQSPDFTCSGLPALSLNCTHRNWTVLSSPGVNEQAIVDPTGLITPLPSGWSLDVWVGTHERLYAPSRLMDVVQTFDENPPHITTSFSVKNTVDVKSEAFFATDLHHQGYVFHQVSVKNSTDTPQSFSLFIAVRPYNPEGVSPIRDIHYLSQQGFVIDNRLGVVLDEKPDNVVCLSFEDGDVSERYKDWEMILQAHCPNGLASAFAEYKVTLQPGEEKSFTSKMSTTPVSPLLKLFQRTLPLTQKDMLFKKINGTRAFKWEEEREKIAQTWAKNGETFGKLSVPDERVNVLFRQNQTHLQSFVGKDKVYAQGFSFQAAKTYEKIYVMLALNNMGGQAISEKLIYELPFFQKNGSTRLIKAEQAGQLLFALHNTYTHVRDKHLLEEHFLKIEAFVKKIKHFAKKWSPNQSFHDRIGKLLTGYTSQEEYLYAYFWALAGLRSAALMSGELQKHDRKEYFFSLYDELMTSLQMVLLYSMGPVSRSTFIPVSTKRLVDAGLVMSLISVYPLHIISADDERINNTIGLLEQFLVNKVLFNSIGYSGFSVFQNAQLGQLYSLRKDKKLFDILEWMLSVATPTGTWPESIHPISLGGSGGDGHSGLACAEFLNLVSSLMSRSEDHCLHLCPFVPADWLEGPGIMLENWETEFGKINFSMRKNDQRIEFDFQPHFHNTLVKVKIYSPFSFTSYRINGQKYEATDTFITVEAAAGKGWMDSESS